MLTRRHAGHRRHRKNLRDERGREAEGLILTCSRCGETVEVYGTSGASLRRGFVKLREACKETGNFYVEEELCPEAPTAHTG